MYEIALEGIDGSGKTTVAQHLSEELGRTGLNVVRVAPYQLANEQLGTDVYSLWPDEALASMAINTLKQITIDRRNQALDEHVDVLIYDRHWMTAFTEIADRDNLISQWDDCFVPTALLKVDVDTALRRCNNDLDETWMNRIELERYARTFCKLATNYKERMFGIYRSDDDVTPANIAHSIQWDINIRR